MTAASETLPLAGSTGDVAPGAPRELARGAAIGRYLVIERIGEGGMGVVYKAYDPDLDRGVALKLVRADRRNAQQRQQLRARLLREAQALARLSHSNVVAVHDVGTHEDDVFVAMELVVGRTLARVLAEDAPPAARIVELFAAAGRGLAAAHAVSIVHRDFKPDNAIVGADGQVRVLDFGLARAARGGEVGEGSGDGSDRSGDGDDLATDPGAIDPGADTVPDTTSAARAPLGSGDPQLTAAGAVLGTPAYMAPEQLAGDAEIDERADQFSFCVALCEALFGDRPAAGAAELPGCARSGAGVPRRMRAALLRGLAVEPRARHPSMTALLDELSLRPVRRAYLAAGGLALAALAALAIAIWVRPVPAAAPCEGAGAEERLAGVWDAERRAAVRAALTRGAGAEAAASVEQLLERYTAAWREMRISSCRATHVLREQSPELLDLRTECLDRHLGELRHLTSLLASADAPTAQRAVASARALEPVDDCANTAALRDAVPPRDPELSRELRDRYTQLRARFSIGDYAPVQREAAELATSAERAGDRWLEASAIYLQARVARQLGALPDAEAQLYRAIEIAETGRASDVVADAWMTLAWLAGTDQGRFAEALRLAGVARGVLERVGGNPRLEASLEDHLGVLHLDRGALVLARHHLERALVLRERLYGQSDSEYATVLQHLAILEQAQGNTAKALELHQRARRITEAELGPRHFDALAMLGAEGATLHELGRDAEAVALLERGIAIATEAAGPDSDFVASFSINLGLARWKLGQLPAARAAFDRAQTIVDARAPDGMRAANLALNLSLLSLDTGDLAAARTHAERAGARYAALLGAEHPDVALALEAQAAADLRSARGADAVAALERALAIRTKAASPPKELANTRFELAKALATTGSPAAARLRALGLADQARGELAAAGDADGARKIAAWLVTAPR